MIVLVEDQRHEMLVRRYLGERGVGQHEVRTVQFPAGKGSAEQWIRTQFAKEVSAYRHRRHGRRANTALIVMVDADNLTVEQRKTQLDHALEEAEVPLLGPNEAVARLIPKRNVETWILCLHGREVEEQSDYKGTRHDWNELIPRASVVLYQWTRPNAVAPSYCVNSLTRGIEELQRLES